MCIDDFWKFDGTTFCLLFENRKHSVSSVSPIFTEFWSLSVLWWVGGVNDNRVFWLVICHEVGIVIARSLPCANVRRFLRCSLRCSYTWELIGYASRVVLEAGASTLAWSSRPVGAESYFQNWSHNWSNCSTFDSSCNDIHNNEDIWMLVFVIEELSMMPRMTFWQRLTLLAGVKSELSPTFLTSSLQCLLLITFHLNTHCPIKNLYRSLRCFFHSRDEYQCRPKYSNPART